MKRNCMLDLETMDTRPTAIVLSIGAVLFDKDGIGETFYTTINIEDCLSHGLTLSHGTFEWWMSQPTEARKALFDNPVTLKEALLNFRRFLASHTELAKLKMWGNGSDFDNAILQNAYGKLGEKAPWDFWNNRCYRTMTSVTKLRANVKGTKHNALDDAMAQAEVMVKIMNGGR